MLYLASINKKTRIICIVQDYVIGASLNLHVMPKVQCLKFESSI